MVNSQWQVPAKPVSPASGTNRNLDRDYRSIWDPLEYGGGSESSAKSVIVPNGGLGMDSLPMVEGLLLELQPVL